MLILERELGPDLEKFAGAGTTTGLLETAIADDDDSEDNYFEPIADDSPSLPLKDVYSPDEIDEKQFQLSNIPDEDSTPDNPSAGELFPFWGLQDIIVFLSGEPK